MATSYIPNAAVLIALLWYVMAGAVLLFLPTELNASQWTLRIFGIGVLCVGGLVLWVVAVR